MGLRPPVGAGFWARPCGALVTEEAMGAMAAQKCPSSRNVPGSRFYWLVAEVHQSMVLRNHSK